MTGLTLAIDTATAACSAALIRNGEVVAALGETVGRGHAERLAPMIAQLLAGHAPPSAILGDCGPGSFTGVRVGLATAIGLAIGWGVPVSGYSSLAALAAAAFADDPALDGCGVAIAGGHGELFVQRFMARPFDTVTALASLAPMAAAEAIPDRVVTGPAADALVAARGTGEARTRLPAAADARRLPAACHLPARPIYGRAPDAKPLAA